MWRFVEKGQTRIFEILTLTRRLTYRRPTPDTLAGVLEKEGKRQVFSFRRR